MLLEINPKLPMRNKEITKDFYINTLNFALVADYGDYLILQKDEIELHFFEFRTLDPKENYGQVYIRTDAVEDLYDFFRQKGASIHPNGQLAAKPWGQKEFSMLDPDHNLLTFGQAI